MNNSKITLEYLYASANISSVAESFQTSNAQVVHAIINFLNSHPESSWNKGILRKLRIELTKLFLDAPGNAKEFAEEYGMKECEFIGFMREVIDETSLITSDSLADKIYRKLLVDRNSLGNKTPKRIIRIIGQMYASEKYVSQTLIAYSYGISRSAVSYILNRGIDEKIFTDDIACVITSKALRAKWKGSAPRYNRN